MYYYNDYYVTAINVPLCGFRVCSPYNPVIPYSHLTPLHVNVKLNLAIMLSALKGHRYPFQADRIYHRSTDYKAPCYWHIQSGYFHAVTCIPLLRTRYTRHRIAVPYSHLAHLHV